MTLLCASVAVHPAARKLRVATAHLSLQEVQSGIVVHVGASSGDLRHSLPLRNPSKARGRPAKW
eukprot:13514015-Alexandrium_andersonii.AAC.1